MREIFADHILETQIDGQSIELLAPEGLIEGIKGLGIDDLSEQDIKYLLRVLTKPELDGAIVMDELLQIMENLGLYDEDEDNEEKGLKQMGQNDEDDDDQAESPGSDDHMDD